MCVFTDLSLVYLLFQSLSKEKDMVVSYCFYSGGFL